MKKFWCGKSSDATEMARWVNINLTNGWEIETSTAAGNGAGIHFVVYMVKEVSDAD